MNRRSGDHQHIGSYRILHRRRNCTANGIKFDNKKSDTQYTPLRDIFLQKLLREFSPASRGKYAAAGNSVSHSTFGHGNQDRTNPAVCRNADRVVCLLQIKEDGETLLPVDKRLTYEGLKADEMIDSAPC